MTETARIADVARVTPAYYGGVADFLDLWSSSERPALWSIQEQALAALAIYGGCVMQAGCGDGKGLVSMLGATAVGAKRPLVLIPGKLLGNFARENARFRRLGFKIPPLEVKAHDFISRNSTYLENYKPDYLFIDESHAFRRRETNRTRRLLRFLDAFPTRPKGGDVTFAVASGTMHASSVLDAAHLFDHALGERSPLPGLKRSGAPSIELGSFANVLDVDGRPSSGDWFTFRPIVERFLPSKLRAYDFAGGKERRAIAREAYDLRRRCVPGLVVSDSDSVEASLVVYTHELDVPEDVRHALAMVDNGVRPDDEELFEDDVSKWRAGQQVSIGCFYRWAWERVGGRDEDWLRARRRWHRAIRRELERRSTPGYDSPGLIAQAVTEDIVATYRHGGPARLSHLHAPFMGWYQLRDRYDVEALKEITWINNFFAPHVVNFARSLRKPAVIWYQSQAMEAALKAAGVKCYGRGTEPPEKAETVGLSLARHGTGANLQDRWSVAVYAEFPPSGELAEQSLARFHRPGQRADVVEAHVFTHTKPFRRNLQSAREKAIFLTRAQGRQRLSFVPIVSCS